MNASWFANVIASANETLTDRQLFFRHAAGLLVFGAVLKLAYLFYTGFTVPTSEAFNVAAAFAARGELADAWGPGTGPTAHLSPGMPLLVGEVYRWLGVGTPAAESLLACISLAFITVTILPSMPHSRDWAWRRSRASAQSACSACFHSTCFSR